MQLSMSQACFHNVIMLFKSFLPIFDLHKHKFIFFSCHKKKFINMQNFGYFQLSLCLTEKKSTWIYTWYTTVISSSLRGSPVPRLIGVVGLTKISLEPFPFLIAVNLGARSLAGYKIKLYHQKISKSATFFNWGTIIAFWYNIVWFDIKTRLGLGRGFESDQENIFAILKRDCVEIGFSFKLHWWTSKLHYVDCVKWVVWSSTPPFIIVTKTVTNFKNAHTHCRTPDRILAFAQFLFRVVV